jgi:hypothetical protein
LQIDQAISDIGEIFNITSKDNVANFLGVKIVKDLHTGKSLIATSPDNKNNATVQ